MGLFQLSKLRLRIVMPNEANFAFSHAENFIQTATTLSSTNQKILLYLFGTKIFKCIYQYISNNYHR